MTASRVEALSLHSEDADFALCDHVAEAWEVVLDACRDARCSIDFEQYILGADDIGQRVLEVLTERAQAGVAVRLLLDGHGSGALSESGAWRALVEAGGAVRFYNPLTWRSFVRLPPRIHRDHRKLVVVDGQRAFVGGVCFEDRMRDWRDTLLRLDGALARTLVGPMTEAFELSWARAGGARRGLTRRPGAPDSLYRGQDGPFRYLVNSPDAAIRRDLYVELMKQIRGARRSLQLATPYFAPQHGMLRHLMAAQRRGVAVSLLLPAVSDHPPLDVLSLGFARRLARAGCEVLYFPDRMMHAKTVVADEAWAAVSSHNLDRLSSRVNLENGVVSTDPGFVALVAEQFERDRAVSTTEEPDRPVWHPVVEPLLQWAARWV